MIFSNKNLTNLFISLITCLIFQSCNSGSIDSSKPTAPKKIEEIKHGLLIGYLTENQLPNSLKLIPEPPKDSSLAKLLDSEKSILTSHYQDSSQFAQAKIDANLHFPDALKAFNKVLPTSITEERTPFLYQLMRRSLTDAGLSTYAAKNHYQRKRPFTINQLPTCTPHEEELLRNDGSYPSGHTAIGWAWALILTEIFPQHTDAILARGRAYGESRIYCNVHWQSDVTEGRFMGASTVAKLHSNVDFMQDLEQAKKEVQ